MYQELKYSFRDDKPKERNEQGALEMKKVKKYQ